MMPIKVYIEYDIIDDPHGGGNQFLKCLRDAFDKFSIMTDDPERASIILYNGHQNHEKVISLRQKYNYKTFIHRMDGLQKLYNRPDDPRQDLAMEMNEAAHGTIFQSEWARKNFKRFGYDGRRHKNTVIHNAVDGNIFKPNYRKIKLITTSWSENWKKGFEVYKYLDETLDFSKYNYSFIGNSPVKFKDIQMEGQLVSRVVANRLQSADIFISASQHDACSNSILEAFSCGLSVIALNDGGNSEMIEYGIHLFDEKEEIIDIIGDIKKSIFPYNLDIRTKNIKQVAEKYIEFFYEVLVSRQRYKS